MCILILFATACGLPEDRLGFAFSFRALADLGTVLRSNKGHLVSTHSSCFVLGFWLLQGEQQIHELQNTLHGECYETLSALLCSA